jgi:hypothetical protein
MIRTLTIITLLAASFSVTAQHTKDEIGNWFMYFGANRISEKLSLHSEVQYRNHELTPTTIEQLLLRTGLNFHINKDALVTAGYAYIASHVYDSEQSHPESEEHRIWQQLIMNNYLGGIKFEHRYRVEQRFVNQDYRNRLRYRLMVFVPLNRPKMEPGALFLGVYDEIFMNTEKTFFDRNRLYGAMGYQVNARMQLQVGVLHQRVNNFGKWHGQFALVFNPDLRKGAGE